MIDRSKYKGQFIIKSNTGVEVVDNRVTNLFLNALINALDGIDPDIQIKYLAIGTSSAAINDADTQLGAEIFRTQFTTSNNTATGEFTTTFTIFDNEAVATWQEIGLFGGSTATSTPNSGKMISRILYNRVKTNLEEIEVTRIDRIQRG